MQRGHSLSGSLDAFADDICLHSTFATFDELAAIVARFGCLLDLLQELGMEVNIGKTIVILRMAGSQLTRANRHFLLRAKEGTFLRVPRMHGQTHIRIVAQHTYLGIRLSYRNHTHCTLQTRLAAGRKASLIIHRWLFCKHAFSTKGRLKLWHQCIFSCVTYGLLHVGLTESDLLKLRIFCIQQLRRIFHQPAHITHIPNHTFLSQHHLIDPLVLFLNSCKRWHGPHVFRLEHLSPPDIVHQINLQPLTDNLARLEHAMSDIATQDHVPPTLPTEHQGKSFVMHPGKLGVRNMSMAHQGLPMCVHCNRHFTTWDRFYYYVEYICPMATWQDQMSSDADARQAVLSDILLQGPDGMNGHPELQQHLLTHCILCDRFGGTSNSVTRRWLQDHHEVFSSHGKCMTQLLASSARQDPCLQCSLPADLRRSCLIIRQLALLAASMSLPLDLVPDQDYEAMLYKCSFSPEVFIAPHGKKQHEEKARKRSRPTIIADTMKQALHRAVQRQVFALILTNNGLIQALNKDCVLCGFQAQRRNSLSRHFRQAHAMQWKEAENLMIELIPKHRAEHECLCDPPSKQKHHQCMIYMQYSLLKVDLDSIWTHPHATVTPNHVDPPPDPPLHPIWHALRCALRMGVIFQVLPSGELQHGLLHTCILCDETFEFPWRSHSTFDVIMKKLGSTPGIALIS